MVNGALSLSGTFFKCFFVGFLAPALSYQILAALIDRGKAFLHHTINTVVEDLLSDRVIQCHCSEFFFQLVELRVLSVMQPLVQSIYFLTQQFELKCDIFINLTFILFCCSCTFNSVFKLGHTTLDYTDHLTFKVDVACALFFVIFSHNVFQIYCLSLVEEISSL